MIHSFAVAAVGGALGAAAFPAHKSAAFTPPPVPAASPPIADHARLAVAYALPTAGLLAQAPHAGARELECLTQAVYFEARGESPQGQAAVAQVVLNRVRHPAFPKTVCGVVYQGAASRHCQFSFACDSVSGSHERGAWMRARKVAAGALAGAVMPQVAGATHFHTASVSPGWGPGLLRVSQVGLHVFYRLGATPRRPAPETAVFTSRPAPRPVEILAPAPAPEAAPAPSVETHAVDAVEAAADAS